MAAVTVPDPISTWPTSGLRVIGIGEILWDILPAGERLGGAPFNTVAHLRRFGWAAGYVTAVGTDARGRTALEEVNRLGVDPAWIAVNTLATGSAVVALDAGGNPEFQIATPAAFEAIEPWPAGSARPACDLIVIGTLAQRFAGVRVATQQLAEASPHAVRLYDVNLRDDFDDLALVVELLEFATVVKLNESEQQVLAQGLALPVGPLETFARALSERFDLGSVCVTRGPRPAGLLIADVYEEAPPPNVRVIDTVGAGDAFAAALGHGLAMAWPVARILSLANRLGSLVASRSGAVPDWKPADLAGNLGIAAAQQKAARQSVPKT